MRIIPVTLVIARATSIIRKYPRFLIRLTHSPPPFQSASRLYYWLPHLLISMRTHSDILNLWSPSQELSNDISHVHLYESFIISTCLRVWGLSCCSFTWGCCIMTMFKICDLLVKSFPMMYHMYVCLKLL